MSRRSRSLWRVQLAAVTLAATALACSAGALALRAPVARFLPVPAPSAAENGATPAAAAPPGVRAVRAVRPPSPPPCTPAPLRVLAGQTLVVGLPGVTSAEDPLAREVLDVGVAGVLLKRTNVSDAGQVRALVDGLRSGSHLKLVVSTDEESGRVSTFRPLFGRSSSPRTLADSRSPREVRAVARGLGERLADLGIDLDLAPVADLDAGPAGGIIGDRSFSADPAAASDYTRAFTRGLRDAGVLAAAKHFPGHGRSAVDTHDAGAVDRTPLGELRATDLEPFRAQIAEGVPVVLLSHVTHAALDPRRPASLAPSAYDLLRELGFDGVAMTDSIGMGAVSTRWAPPQAAVLAVQAGADAVLTTDGSHTRAMRDALVAAVRDGRLDRRRVAEAAGRVLTLKGLGPRRVAALTCLDGAP